MKRSPIRKRRAASWKTALDKLCRQVVFARDHSKCQKCGAGGRAQWAHILSRRYLSSRWDTRNSLVLCAGCHLWWHHQPLLAAKWFEEAFPLRHKILILRSHGSGGGKLDREAIRLGLEAELGRYE